MNQAPSQFHRIFKQHPQAVGETYFQHFKVSGRFFILLLGLACAALIHAVFPNLFERTVSQKIMSLAEGMRARSADNA